MCHSAFIIPLDTVQPGYISLSVPPSLSRVQTDNDGASMLAVVITVCSGDENASVFVRLDAAYPD
jgi:hypothetical protein